jgi:hypothetical protein
VQLIPLYDKNLRNTSNEMKKGEKVSPIAALKASTPKGKGKSAEGEGEVEERSVSNADKSQLLETLVADTTEGVNEERPLKRKFSIMGTLL